MASAPIRQPRGPPSSSSGASPFVAPGGPSAGDTPGPPLPDAESLLRRNKTVATATRPGASPTPTGGPGGAGSAGGAPGGGMIPGSGGVDVAAHRRSFGAATVDAYHQRQLRSGSYPSPGLGGFTVLGGQSTMGSADGNLVRRASNRSDFASRGGGTTQETLIEAEGDDQGSATELGAWGKGLGRQSSLPSRRLNGVNPGLFTHPEPAQQQSSSGSMPPPPPRPPRRVYHPSVDASSSSPPPSAGGHSRSSSHGPSHSLSSLSMLVNPGYDHYEQSATSPVPSTPGSAGHSTTGGFPSSSAASAADRAAGVSRTQSLRAHMHHNPQAMVDMSTLGRSASMRVPGELAYSRTHQSPPPPPPPFSLATPPRNKGHLPHYAPSDDGDVPGADLARHHSLGRSQALLSLDQREDLRRRLAASPGGASQTSGDGHSRHMSEIDQSGLGRNLWTPGAPMPGDDGWSGSSATAAQQLQDALDSLSLRDGQRPAPPMGEEPAWVTNLVGMPGQPSPQAPARQLGPGGPPGWDDRNQSPYGLGGPWGGAGGPSLHPPPLLYQQQQQLYAQTQAQLKLAAAGIPGGLPPIHQGLPPMPLPQNYMGQNYMGSLYTGHGGYGTPPPGPLPPHAGPGPVPGMPLSAQDVDVLELARRKGLNPATFDCHPPFARFFVIKSYTEDDVQKSLKHEVWSSTVLGNKRLDTAYRESHDKGPIYLFFSVNSSRVFCGVAEMTSPVDENKTATIWAQAKWKGLFHVKWIMVRDVPTSALRHLRLTNTPEAKPITTSRDTQELPYAVGCDALQVFQDYQHKAKTSLLQDYAYYERRSAAGGPGGPGGASPAPQGTPGGGDMTPVQDGGSRR